jgi:replicative DNA helicase
MEQKKDIRKKLLSSMANGSEIGKMPPQVIELEEAVLGACLLEREAVSLITTILKPEYFYKEQNGRVFNALVNLHKRNQPTDILTVTQELKKTEELEIVGGAYYVSSLTSRIASSANIEFHARIVHEKYLLREIIRLGTNVIQQAYENDADPFDIVDKIHKQTSEITNILSNNIKDVGTIFNEVVDEIKNVQEHGITPGIPSGFKNIDDETGGWQPGNFIILAARPGMGKTALAVALAKNPAIQHNKPVAIFSLEMTARELVGRMAASESKINATKINQKKIDRKELQDMGARCFNLVGTPIFIDDTANIKFSDLRAKAKKLHHDKKIELIIIDYLQLMHGDEKGNREQEISYITRNLKALAKELEIPIIALAQLSRQVENRTTGDNAKRPQLSDLRESGAIEQDADIVSFIFRPEAYGLYPNGYPYADLTLPTKHLMIFDIAKGRGMKICEVPLRFFGEFMQCLNYDLEPISSLEANNNFL